ncbi:[protein-PII] uridylyltransferase [Candidatus Sumerlaeota bacterium]|nr:[protein-PII] uridylyltransferase [Candidatus Sumerlaeota bacterium]
MSAPTAENSKVDPEYLASLRGMLEAARDAARARHRKAPGLEVACLYSADIERIVLHHMEEMARRFNADELRGRIALIAVGGFGRNELCFHSDIDFCFITEREPTPEEEGFIRAVLYPLWDLKLDLGYGVHSIRDCINTLGNDLTKATAFLDTRHLWGAQMLWEELVERIHGKLHKHHILWFINSLKDEMRTRHERYGDTVFLLEPDVKNSRGGLRDVHQILWIAFTLYGASDIGILVRNGLVSQAECDRLLSAWSFLVDVRNSLHLTQNRRVDKLTLERQIQVASSMGFEPSETALAEESLMRAYYDHALVVERLSQRLMAITLMRTPGTRESTMELEPSRRVDRDFNQRGTHIWIERADLPRLSTDPHWPLRLFLNAAREKLEPTEDSIRLVEEFLPNVDDEFRRSPIARDLFLAMLNTAGKLADTLRIMNRCGFLSAYIPEFAGVRNLPRIDHYHQYTVDEHLIRTIGVCEYLLTTENPRGMQHVGAAAKEVLRVDLLNLALLLHDVGKGEGRAHVIRGMHMAQRITERMQLRPIEQEIVRSLVAHHQKMSHMALRRDIEDPALAKELAEGVGASELLRMLYVHTACDVRGVSPDSWNEWRGRLLADLYERTMDMLRGIKRDHSSRTHAKHLMDQITEVLQEKGYHDINRAELDHFFSDMPERYLRSVSIDAAVNHFLLSAKITNESRIHARVDTYEESTYVEVTFVARDAPGLFSNLCGALAAKRFNILSAQIYTSASGEAVDVFQVEIPPIFRDDVDSILERICATLEKIMRTGERPSWSKTIDKSAVFPITQERLNLRPPRVDIRNDVSPTHTVVEVRAPDRPGLLSDITATFDHFSINIDLAFIATESYQVVDVFYVTDLETNKLKESGKLNSLKEELMKTIHSQLQVKS